MHDAFVRSQPAVLWMLEDGGIDGAEIRHQRFDLLADQDLRQLVNGAQTRSLPPPSVNARPMPAFAPSVRS